MKLKYCTATVQYLQSTSTVPPMVLYVRWNAHSAMRYSAVQCGMVQYGTVQYDINGSTTTVVTGVQIKNTRATGSSYIFS